MKIKLPVEKKDEEIDIEKDEVVDESDTVEEDADAGNSGKSEQDRESRDLELENARLKGQLEVLSQKPAAQPLSDQARKDEELKQVLRSDADRLDDDAFQEKYQMSKLKALDAIYKHDLETTKVQSAESMARLEAKEELIEKYGKSYLKYKSEIEKAVQDAAPEVRRDASRLARFMDTQYLALSRGEEVKPPVKDKKKEESMDRRKIVDDFEKPLSDRVSSKREQNEDQDLLDAPDRELASHFGITKKSELKDLESDYIPMDIGGGFSITGNSNREAVLVRPKA